MAINYNLVTTDRLRMPIEYVCFGVLGKLNHIGTGAIDRVSPSWPKRVNSPEHMQKLFDSKKLRAIEFSYKETTKGRYGQAIVNEACLQFEEAFRQYSESFPTIRSIASIHKGKGLVRVETRGQPMDKVMFVLTVLRNANNYISGKIYAPSTESEIEIRIPDFKKRALFDMCFTTRGIRRWGGGKNVEYISPAKAGEGSILLPNIIGKQAILRLYNEQNDLPWFQGTFEDSDKGYKRDVGFFSDGEFMFGANVKGYSFYSLVMNKYASDPATKDMWAGQHLVRHLFDCLAIEGDQPLISGAVWDPLVGYMFPYHDVVNKSFSSDVLVEEFLSIFE